MIEVCLCLLVEKIILNLNIIESSLKFSVLQSVSNFVGWGEKIEWKTLQDGLEEAKKR